MKKDAVKRGIAAFSRAELFFCLAALALLFAAILPGAALSGRRSDHITCIDNLRRIGKGFHVWAFEHQDGNPWTVPVTSDGTALSGHLSKPGNAWFEFAAVSNEQKYVDQLLASVMRWIEENPRVNVMDVQVEFL